MNTQNLYVLVDSETGKICKHNSKSTLAVFLEEKQLKRHAWRYGSMSDKKEVHIYESAHLIKLLEVNKWNSVCVNLA